MQKHDDLRVSPIPPEMLDVEGRPHWPGVLSGGQWNGAGCHGTPAPSSIQVRHFGPLPLPEMVLEASTDMRKLP